MTSAPRTTGDLPDDPADRTLPQLLARNAGEYPQLPGLSWQSADPDSGWTTLGWAEIHERTRSLAAGYRALGVGRGDHVLLMMPNRPEHWLSDLALVRLGAIPVSVYG
ncbi:AMP-binding protein, partial [Streptomyces sp. NPDC057757]|uniref:AMP-binding protein n=1 Tax=Streptomyces sp. NPDC057757 TaxID=3346241 RepID=UPI0036D1CDEC